MLCRTYLRPPYSIEQFRYIILAHSAKDPRNQYKSFMFIKPMPDNLLIILEDSALRCFYLKYDEMEIIVVFFYGWMSIRIFLLK